MGKFKKVIAHVLGLDENGWEKPDPKPVSLHVGIPRPPTLQQQMQRFIANHNRMIANAGYESVDEANDFDMPDEGVEFNSPHEVDETLEAEAAHRRQVQRDEAEAAALRARYKKPHHEAPKPPKNDHKDRSKPRKESSEDDSDE